MPLKTGADTPDPYKKTTRPRKDGWLHILLVVSNERIIRPKTAAGQDALLF